MLDIIVWNILIKDEKIYLLGRFYQDHIEYTLIGGHVEYGELVKQALIREAFEETGILINENDLEFTLVTGDQIHSMKEINKHISGDWFSLNNLPDNIGPLAKIGIKSLFDNKKYSEYGV